MNEKSRSKHESQLIHRSAWSPVRSLVSSVLVQKQVGHTIVQLPQATHLWATSFQRWASVEAASKERRSTVGSAGRIPAAASATVAEAACAVLWSAVVCATARKTSAPRHEPVRTTNLTVPWGPTVSVSF